MREPLELLIELLVNGGRVQADGCEYAMGEDGSLCVIMRDEEGGGRREGSKWNAICLPRKGWQMI